MEKARNLIYDAIRVDDENQLKQLLQENEGLDLNEKNKNGQTFLEAALLPEMRTDFLSDDPKEKVIPILIQHGAKLEDFTTEGKIFTPKNLDLSSLHAKRINLSAVQFEKIKLDNAIIEESNLKMSRFSQCEMKNLQINGSWLNLSNFQEVKAEGIILKNVDATMARFLGCGFAKGKFEGVGFSHSTFEESNLKGVDFTNNITLTGVKFLRSDLSDSNFSKVEMPGAKFLHCHLDNAILDEANLSGSDCSKTIFNDASLKNANLSNAILNGATFINADLGGADLSVTFKSLTHAQKNNHFTNFCGADLRGAKLKGFDLINADLRHIQIYRKDLGGHDLFKLKTLAVKQHSEAFNDSERSLDSIYESVLRIQENDNSLLKIHNNWLPHSFFSSQEDPAVQEVFEAAKKSAVNAAATSTSLSDKDVYQLTELANIKTSFKGSENNSKNLEQIIKNTHKTLDVDSFHDLGNSLG